MAYGPQTTSHMANNKETVEANKALGSLITIGYDATADGEINVNDAIAAIPKIGTIQEGVQGVGAYPTEASTAGIPEKQARRSALEQSIRTGNEVDDYDLIDGFSGIQSLIEFGIRKGTARGAKKALEKVQAGDTPMRSLSADGEMTDEEALAWVNS